MGIKIGGVWNRVSKNGNRYISIAFDKAFLELCPQLKNVSLIGYYIKESDRKNDKSPSYSLNLEFKEAYEANKKEENGGNVVKFDDFETDEFSY